MSVIVEEKPQSRKQSGALQSRRASREYIILGTQIESEARDALIAFIAGQGIATLDGLVVDSPDVREAYLNIWDGTVTWITPAKKEEKEKEEQQVEQEPGDPPVITFDTTGGTKHINVALDTTAWGDDAPEVNNLIGVNDDGSVTGVDVPAPALNWTEQHTFLKSELSWSYFRTLYKMTGRVNDDEFRSLPAGSVRFMGVSGQAKSETKFTLTFKFETAEEEENIEIGNGITIGHKKGFEYAWVRTKIDTDEATKSTTRKPIGAYTQQVSPEADFSELGIGIEEIPL